MATTLYSNSLAVTKAPKDGVSVVSITKKYLLTTTDSAPSKDGNVWLDEPPVMTETNKYLWAYDIITYSDETTSETDVTCIGVFGERGIAPVTCYLSQEGFILPVNEYGVIASADYLEIQITVSLIQLYNGVYTPLNVGSNLDGNGTFTISVTSESISYIAVSGSLVKATKDSAISSSVDVAYIIIDINYIDFVGKRGSFKKTVSITKAQDGKTGTHTLREWYLSESYTTAPDDTVNWQTVMPNIANTDKYLWVREKVVNKGVDPDTLSWNTPKLEKTLYYSIDGASLIMGNKQIELSGEKVLINGSVTADKIDVDDLMTNDLVIQDKTKNGVKYTGKIRSKGYTKGEWNRALNSGETEEDRRPGFYMDNDGYLESTRGFFRHATVYDLTMVGGEIQGDNNPLNTFVSSTGETSYKNVDGVFSYVHGETFRTFIKNNCPTVAQVTAEDIQQDIDFQSSVLHISGLGTFYHVVHVAPIVTKLERSSEAWSVSVSNNVATCTYTFQSSNVPYDGYDASLDYTLPVFFTRDDLVYRAPTTNISYRIDNGDWIDVNAPGYDFQRSTAFPASGLEWSIGFHLPGAGNHTCTVRHVSKQYNNAPYYFLYGSAGSFTEIIKYSFRYSGYLAYRSASIHDMISINELSLDEYVAAEYSDENNGKFSSSLPHYSTFEGIKKKEESDSAYSYLSPPLSISAKNLVIGGVSRGEGTVVYTAFSVVISANGQTLLDFDEGDYFTSDNFPTFSFTSLDQEKGVYVDDLFVRVNSSGAYKGRGNLGSGTRPFNNAYLNYLTGKTVTLTDNIKTTLVQVGANSKVKIGEDSESGYINIENVNKGSDAGYWHIDALDNLLRFVRNGATVPALIDQFGLSGARFKDTELLYNVLISENQQVTKNLNDDMKNYAFIYIELWFSAGYAAAPVLLPAQRYTNSNVFCFPTYYHGKTETRIVMATDLKYGSFYFPTSTQLATYDSSDDYYITIIGFK